MRADEQGSYRGRHRAWLAVLICSALVAGCVGCTVHAAGSAPSLAASPSPTPADGDSTGPITWQRVPTDVAIVGGRTPGLRLADVAPTGDGLVAVGRDDHGGIVVNSPDGIQWTRIPDTAALDRASLVAVAVGRAQTLAVGSVGASAHGFLWRTTNGTRWSGPYAPFTDNVAVVDIAVGPPAWLVAGSVKVAGRIIGMIWRSIDGHTWVPIRLPASPRGEYRLTSVAWLGPRFVALGRRAYGLGPEVLAWTSVDGRSWRRGGDIPVARDGEITDLALAPGGRIVAVGAQSWTPVVGAAFTSADGTAWTRAPSAPFEGRVPRGLSCDAAGCVAVGETQPVQRPWWSGGPGYGVTWASPDGRSWSAGQPTSAGAPALGSTERIYVGMERVVRTSGGSVVLGWSVTEDPGTLGDTDRAATWVAPAVSLPPAIPAQAIPAIAGSWRALPPFDTPRARPVATAGLDGRIYVLGGTTIAGDPTRNRELASVEIFDPASRTWKPGVPIPGPLSIRAAAVTAPDGRIFLFHRTSLRVLVFDPARGRWSPGPSIPDGRWAVSAILGPDGRITVSTTAKKNAATRFYLLDPVTGRWTRGGPTNGISPRLRTGGARLYGLGGIRAWSTDPMKGASRALAAIPAGTELGESAVGLDGLIWTAATTRLEAWGYRGGPPIPTLLAYDPVADRWSFGPSRPEASQRATTAVAAVGRLYFVGSTETSTEGSAWEVVIQPTGSP